MLSKFISKKNSELVFTIQHWLIVSCAFSFLLLSARIIITGYETYLFLVWNLFLAFVPYAITQWAAANSKILKNKMKLAAVLFSWLLFVPNSFYILTDLFHLDTFDSAPKWFDL